MKYPLTSSEWIRGLLQSARARAGSSSRGAGACRLPQGFSPPTWAAHRGPRADPAFQSSSAEAGTRPPSRATAAMPPIPGPSATTHATHRQTTQERPRQWCVKIPIYNQQHRSDTGADAKAQRRRSTIVHPPQRDAVGRILGLRSSVPPSVRPLEAPAGSARWERPACEASAAPDAASWPRGPAWPLSGVRRRRGGRGVVCGRVYSV